jgi:hypothetical protein
MAGVRDQLVIKDMAKCSDLMLQTVLEVRSQRPTLLPLIPVIKA